ncbi:hypothetical protein ACO2Q8_11415 [Larkinella sp. VNQ87]|uniref:hypothetical protein n=1 Tax=Larkinella sp. VNQ87 TaxID=3400921 RepID=UPI003C0D434C
MTKLRNSHLSGPMPTPLTRPHRRPDASGFDDPEPWRPDWLMILMVSLFILTLLIAWLVDIPALLR